MCTCSEPGGRTHLGQTQVLGLHVDPLCEGVQHLAGAGVLLADAHQELRGQRESVGRGPGRAAQEEERGLTLTGLLCGSRAKKKTGRTFCFWGKGTGR